METPLWYKLFSLRIFPSPYCYPSDVSESAGLGSNRRLLEIDFVFMNFPRVRRTALDQVSSTPSKRTDFKCCPFYTKISTTVRNFLSVIRAQIHYLQKTLSVPGPRILPLSCPDFTIAVYSFHTHSLSGHLLFMLL
ncbi:hypothetical protein NPIL_618501 [Nephila pilipes]|uniref:Uncharacterized protein n=1 Tax=Nephila pilipes TaxID=299642 RepID=A0A8X6PSJ2_NEPPI|nr:hypothetical protein NPIL_618501 [Nephila pilipes]